jgi:ABC-type transport system involved in cytochrome bd biosynthesis fused ATPase/permease subunit
VWILDEPTEHINDVMADELISNLISATAGQTLILATHRISDTANLDHVSVLDQGLIKESGSPSQLAASSGDYQRLRDRETLARSKNVS